MRAVLEILLNCFENGQLSRREFVAQALAAASLFAGVKHGRTQSAKGNISPLTFKVSEINHVALRVTDLDRSQKFYEDVLGMELVRKLSSARFMAAGPHFVALFKGDEARFDHLAFTLPGYEQEQSAQKLRQLGIVPQLEEERIYFNDPDGHQLQIEHPEAWPGREGRPKN